MNRRRTHTRRAGGSGGNGAQVLLRGDAGFDGARGRKQAAATTTTTTTSTASSSSCSAAVASSYCRWWSEQQRSLEMFGGRRACKTAVG